MKVTIENLKDQYEISRSLFEPSEIEAIEVRDMFTNRQFTDAQIAELGLRGQPAETFNIVALFTRAMTGFLDTVANDVQVKARTMQSEVVSHIVNDGVQYIMERNNFDRIKKKMQLDGMLSGLMCVYHNVVETGETDQYGRPIYDIQIEHIPSWQVFYDPLSKKEDKSDARWQGRFMWMSEEEVIATFGKKKFKKLEDYYNYLDDTKAEFETQYRERFTGKYKIHDNYLITHTVMKDGDKTWSVMWADETILSKKEITYKKVRFPYRIVNMNDNTDRTEHYGIFREVVESQKAINQALIQIQMLVNTSRAFIEGNAVEDSETFKEEFNRINSVITVKYLEGIKIEDMSKDVLQQYAIIDKAFSRIQQVLGVNDSFLGQAYASDSGRKVQIQKNQSVGMLQYVTTKVQHAIQMIGEDVTGLMQQYMTASQVIRVSDKITGDRYISMNQPLTQPTGQMDPQTGMPQMAPVMVPSEDPASGDLVYDATGALVMEPLDDPDTSIKFSDVEVKVESVSYNDSDERNQLLMETMVNGPAGQFLQAADPAGYATIVGLTVKDFGAKYSGAIADVFMETAMKIGQGQLTPALQQIMSGTGNNPAAMGQLGGSGQATASSGQIPKPGREGGPNGSV